MRLPVKLVASVLGGVDPFAYRASWLHTIYVATTGNDTTGNGTKANPYLTLKKAMTVAVAGDGILVANGTYAEAQGAGVNGYWSVSKNLTDWLVIEPELGPSGAVTITGTAGTDINVYISGTNSHIKFRYLTFGLVSGSSTIVRIANTANNLFFDHCTWNGGGSGSYGLYITPSGAFQDVTVSYCSTTNGGASFIGSAVSIPSGQTFTNLVYDYCTMTGGSSSYGVTVLSTGGTGDVAITNSTLGGRGALSVNGGTVTVTNCTMNGNGSTNCVLFGVDGTSGNSTVGIISNSTIDHNIGQVGHALIFGAGCTTGSYADNVTIPHAYDYGIVIKECTGVEIRNCNVTSGSSSAILFKAAASPNVHNNTFTGVPSTSAGVFQLRNGDTGNKCATWQFQNNIITGCTSSAKALNIGNATHDNGGGICDYNRYQNNSGLGVVRNDANVVNLSELQAAWADYDVTTNDAHSTVV